MAPSRALFRQASRLYTTAARQSIQTSSRQLSASSRVTTASASHPLRTNTAPFRPSIRAYSTDHSAPEAPDYLSEGELKIFNMIVQKLEPVKLEVQDISGGCGSMYALDIVSAQFKGLPVIKQHRLVNSALADEIKKWHGVQLKTKAP